MKKTAIMTIVALPLLCSTAMAQSTNTAPAPMPKADTAAPRVDTMTTASIKSPMLGTQLWKQGVYDTAENRIGEVDDLVISETGQIQNVVVGVGGFLGIGEKWVSLPYSSLKPVMRNNQLWFVVDQTKDQLKAAPAFDKTAYKH